MELKVSKYGVISGPYFPVFGLNTEIYGVNLRIQSKYRTIRTRNNSVFGQFSRNGNPKLYQYLFRIFEHTSNHYFSKLYQMTTSVEKPACINLIRNLIKDLSYLDLLIRNLQKQLPDVFYEKRCSQKYHRIDRKTPVPESLF